MLHYVSDEYGVAGGVAGQFEFEMSIPGNHNRMSLVSANLPKSFYMIGEDRNMFLLDANTITVPPGNYSVSELVNTLNELLQPLNSSVVFDRKTGKMTLTTTALTITFPATSILYLMMGCDRGVYPIIGDTWTSPDVCIFQSLSLAWVNCSMVSDSASQSYSDNLAVIPCNTEVSYSFIQYNNPNVKETGKRMISFGGEGLVKTTVKWSILDDSGEILDFNGLSVQLLVYTWREAPAPDLYGLLREFIAYQIQRDKLQDLTKQNDNTNQNRSN